MAIIETNGLGISPNPFPRPDPKTLMNPPPFAPHPLVQVRAGKVKSVFNLPLQSAIHKIPINTPVQISETGIAADEHAWWDHGGPDKALLHYCSGHYASWRKEIPESTRHFNAGAFGENLVSEEVNERSVCIGDVIAIGDHLLVQVTEPRAPCNKLNHRFEVHNMAKRSQMLFRTGWMYRILQTGVIQPGDQIRLVKRKHPEWTVARVQYFLYHDMDNMDFMKELIELKELGETTRRLFRKRIELGMENQDPRLYGDGVLQFPKWSQYQILQKQRETSRVTSFILETAEEIDEVEVQPGSHVKLKLGGKLERSYSVVGGTTKRFELGISLEAASKGGSKFLHEETKIGDKLMVGQMTASFPLSKDADHHVIIAGGVGITALLAALKHLQATSQSYELHLAVSDETPFERYIIPLGNKAKVYSKAQGQSLDIATVIRKGSPNTHLYCCGPQRMMDAVKHTAKSYGVEQDHVHFEAFQVETSGDPFTAELAVSKKTVEVAGNQTLLDALRATGMAIDSSCEAGNCGTCKTMVSSGRVEHRGEALMDQEKKTAMLVCVSRGIGRIVLDL